MIAPPRSRAGDAIGLRAEMDLAIGLSACSATLCNGGPPGPIAYEVLLRPDPQNQQRIQW